MTDAHELTLALGGRWHGRYGAAPCPVCQPERREGQNALTLADAGDARLLAHCKRAGCDFRDILAAAGIAPGSYTSPHPTEIAKRETERRVEIDKRAMQARRCWDETVPIEGSIAEYYLRETRAITCDLPATLRYSPECWHGPSSRRLQAMVALVEGGETFAVHRTYLRDDGSGKADLTGGNKMMLGAVMGGAVRLTSGPGRLIVCEGLETGLSLASGLVESPAHIWAGLSAAGMRGLLLPDIPGRLAVATDSDDRGAGYAAGIALADRAHALGWRVSLLPAPDGFDFNDVLRGVVSA